MLEPELRAGGDPLLGEKNFTIFVPGLDPLGGAADGLDDRLLDARQRKHAAQAFALQPMLRVHALDEGAHVFALRVERARSGIRGCGQARGQQGAAGK